MKQYYTFANLKVTATARQGEETPLQMASLNGHVEVAAVLLANGATVDARSQVNNIRKYKIKLSLRVMTLNPFVAGIFIMSIRTYNDCGLEKS